jgi:Kdo2-lipid IVA lauroyltransferase/acyltransferase
MPWYLQPARALLWLLGLMPLRVLHALGAALGVALGSIKRTREARITRRNLELCFPEWTDTARRHFYRQAFREMGKALLELGWLWGRAPQRALATVREVEGEEVLNEALAAGRGVILAAPHLGAWELLNLWVGTRTPMALVYRVPQLAALEPLLLAVRGRQGAEQIRADGPGVRRVYRRLAEGRLVGILPDQRPKSGEGEYAPFFGIQTLTMVLLSRLAQRTGAAVVFGYAERLPAGQGFRIRLKAAPAGIADPDIRVAVAALNRGVEACAREALAQYQWSYKRFSHPPPGDTQPRY